MNTRTISVVIPTNKQQVLTLKSLEGIPNLEILIETVPNVSRARNAGVKKARGEIIAILDDDIEFSKKWFMYHCKFIRQGIALWNDRPCVIFITKHDYLKSRGFDEGMALGEVQEFLQALVSAGITVKHVDERGIKVLVPFGTTPREKRWKFETLVYLRYNSMREWWKIIRWQRNPMKLLKIGLWVVWWKLMGLQKRKKLE